MLFDVPYISFCSYLLVILNLILIFSVIMSDVMGALPLGGSGFWSNGGGPGSTGVLSSNEDFLSWLGNIVLPVLFQVVECDTILNLETLPSFLQASIVNIRFIFAGLCLW